MTGLDDMPSMSWGRGGDREPHKVGEGQFHRAVGPAEGRLGCLDKDRLQIVALVCLSSRCLHCLSPRCLHGLQTL